MDHGKGALAPAAPTPPAGAASHRSGAAWRNALSRARSTWRRIRAWRRIRFTAGGFAFSLGTFAVGFAAMNTGNNLLYLLLGSMLGFIIVSSWLSEQAVRDLHIERRAPRAVTVGQALRLTYDVSTARLG